MNFLEKAHNKLERMQDIVFAKDVKNRDGWKCVICGSTERLNCHHIIPREHRDLRHNMLNAVTLCVRHHKFSLEISPHRNSFAFVMWLEKNRNEQYKYLKDRYNINESHIP